MDLHQTKIAKAKILNTQSPIPNSVQRYQKVMAGEKVDLDGIYRMYETWETNQFLFNKTVKYFKELWDVHSTLNKEATPDPTNAWKKVL